MPRTPRLEYEGAFYHVMNRGRARQAIFHGDAYYSSFYKTLEEAHQRFGVVVHAYCLMGNHYHLLLQTPHANLSRAMRHINGVYTQRYNKLRRSDGPLFRGRFKSIVVDADAYLLQLSRYIHTNPMDMYRPLVNQLEDYPCSSYLAYINAVKPPKWLDRDLIYQMLGKRQRYSGYRNYVEQGVDEDIRRFYSKGNVASVLGDKGFKERLVERKDLIEEGLNAYGQLERPTPESIIDAISGRFGVERERLIKPSAPRQSLQVRKFAMYACQRYCDMKLSEIAKFFQVKRSGSVGNAIHQVRVEIDTGDFPMSLDEVDGMFKSIIMS